MEDYMFSLFIKNNKLMNMNLLLIIAFGDKQDYLHCDFLSPQAKHFSELLK